MVKTSNWPGKGTAGFTLLEVLVAVVVLSIGLLGLASLQVNGLRSNHSAYMRTQATLLAEELADRMRANRVGFTANNYDMGDATVAAAVALVPACRTVAGCPDAADMARNDIAEWQQALAALLPNGQGVVCLDAVPVETMDVINGIGIPTAPSCDGGTTYAIKIWWDDNRDGAPNQRFVVTLNN